jgi:hypothetical protein
VLNVIPVIYFILILRHLNGSIHEDRFRTFSSASGIVLPAILPSFAVFGLYRLWIAVVEFRPGWFYYKDDKEMADDMMRCDVSFEGERRLDPTIKSLNLKKLFQNR